MSRPRVGVLVLMATALLCWQVLPTGADLARSGFEDCSTTAWIATGGVCLQSCSSGDGTTLSAAGAVITVIAKDAFGRPLEGVPAEDLWLLGCAGGLTPCGGFRSGNADAPTDVNGMTTISSALAVGGCDAGVKVAIQGFIIADPEDCANDLCLPMDVRSADINGDLSVDTIDFGLFGLDYPSPPKAFNPCVDFNCGQDLPGPPPVIVGIVDFGLYGLHHFHNC